MISNGGSVIVSGRRKLGIVFFALLAALFASALLANPAWAVPVLDVEKTDDPDPVAVGEILTYTVEVTNIGNQNATRVRLTDDLDSNTTFVSASTTKGRCTEPAEGTSNTALIDVTCGLGTLAPGGSATVTIQVVPTATGTIINEATAQSQDVATVTDTDIIRTTVVPNLEITKLDDPDPVTTEDLLLYTLRVTNQGRSTLGSTDNIVVIDDLPLDDVDLVSVESSDFDCDPVDPSNGRIRCDLSGSLGAQQTATVEIVVEPEEGSEGTIENTAEVRASNIRVDRATVSTTVENGDGDNDNDGTDDDDDDDDDNDGTNDDDDNDDDNDGIDDGDDNDNNDEDLSDLEDAEADLEELEGEISTLENEATTGDDDFDDDGSGVSASSGEDGAEASTPGAFAESGGDPDEQAPVSGPQGDVEDEIETEGPLPETGGASVAAGTSLALVLFGVSILALRLVSGWRRRRT